MTPEERAHQLANGTHDHPAECRGKCPLARDILEQLRAAIAEEREACAAIVEHGATPRCSIDGKRVPDPVLLRVAAAIRART